MGSSPEITLQQIQNSLFAAIEQDRLDCVPGLATAYTEQMRRRVYEAQNRSDINDLSEALQPLERAIQLVNVVKAHQAARLAKLAVNAAYQSSSPAHRGQTLHVEG